MTIDAYLAELERRLPRLAGRRARGEVREHLRDATAQYEAEGASRVDAESSAVRDFGPVEQIARRLSVEIAVRETRVAGVLALLATAFFVFPLYVVPENTLPPATWVDKPQDVAVLQLAMVTLWVAAGALALVATALAWTRLPRFAAPVVALALGALAGSTLVGIALTVRWFSHTPATPNWALAAPLAAVCVVACAGAAAWARSSRRRLELAD
jgi:hypothetical protein